MGKFIQQKSESYTRIVVIKSIPKIHETGRKSKTILLEDNKNQKASSKFTTPSDPI